MTDMASCRVRDCFAEVEAPRVDQGKRHHLLDIITIALLGVICGADSWTEVETCGLAKEVWLRQFLALPNGIPSHDTFGRAKPPSTRRSSRPALPAGSPRSWRTPSVR